MHFSQPEWLFLLALLPIAGFLPWWLHRRRPGGMRFSSVAAAKEIPKSLWMRLRGLPGLLRVAVIALGILALARPQVRDVVEERYAEGVDVMLVLDTSTSMRAQDFSPNRFEAARDVAAEFIRGRTSDRIGLVVFAAHAFTQAPLTLDYDFLLRMLNEVHVGIIEDGTAVGTAIATAVSRLSDSSAESKVMILLTDGANNRGEIDPVTASQLARAMNVRIYTIGISGYDEAPYPFEDPFGGQRRRMIPIDIDEEMMATVAENTGGRYFRATNREALREIYAEIGSMETTRIEERIYTDFHERFALFLWPAFGLLLLEIVLSNTRLRRIP